MSTRPMKPISQILRDAKPVPKTKMNIDLAVCTTAGIILDVKITPDVEKALRERKYIPTHFIGGMNIMNYMIAPSYEAELRAQYGEIKSKDMINRLKAFLESKKSKQVAQAEAPAAHSLVLE